MEISGNTILITGGTSGIGLGFAQLFLELDNKVIICGRREHRLIQIREEKPEIITKICDVSKEEERKELYNWAIANHPGINVLINNAGVQLHADLTQPLDMARVKTEIDVNFYGPVHLSSLFVSHLSKQDNPAIINISSGLAFTPGAFVPIYCATKAAMHSYTMSLRHQLRNTSLKVFEIIPPSVDTELGHDHRSDPSESHGGISVSEFLEGAMEALKNDKLEAPIGQAKNLHAQRDDLFEMLNQHR